MQSNMKNQKNESANVLIYVERRLTVHYLNLLFKERARIVNPFFNLTE